MYRSKGFSSILILIVTSFVVIFFLLLVKNSQLQNTLNNVQNKPDINDATPSSAPQQSVEETGTDTYCKLNSDCWCKNFTGAGFIPGKVESSCDLKTNRCIACHYL